MSLERVKTEVLNLAYEQDGPRKGEPLLLLHGWPDSPRTWDGVLPALHKAGYRTIVPYLRGYGPTTFRSGLFRRTAKKTGQPVAFAQDMIDLADHLRLSRFHFVGHDWGARTGYALAALFASRLKSLTAISVPFQPGPHKPPSLPQAKAHWYQWYLCTQSGAQSFASDPFAFAHTMWETWSPKGWFTEGEFAEAAKSWENEDFVEITLHSYRSRWNAAPKNPHYDLLQDRYEATMQLHVPTLLIHGLEDACALAETTDGAGRYFSNRYRRALIDNVGHFVQREQPEQVAEQILQQISENAA